MFLAQLNDYVSIRDIALGIGRSYSYVYSLATRGLFGEPVAVGRSHLYPLSRVNETLEKQGRRPLQRSPGTR